MASWSAACRASISAIKQWRNDNRDIAIVIVLKRSIKNLKKRRTIARVNMREKITSKPVPGFLRRSSFLFARR